MRDIRQELNQYRRQGHVNMIHLLRAATIALSVLGGLLMTIEGVAAPNPALQIKDISAPHPKHCIDERQWRGLSGHNPFQIFDNDLTTMWQPCRYALKDEGYTLNIDFIAPIFIDGLELRQLEATNSTPVKKRQRKQKKTKTRGENDTPQRLERVQVLFFNHNISTQYPVYFQDLLFEGGDIVRVKYDGVLSWNSRLLGDPMFDERRRALKLPPKGMAPPLEVHKLSFVFPQFDETKTPPAITELKLFHKGQAIKVHDLKKSETDYNDVMSRVYDLMIRDFMLIGETRAMIFAQTGTIWSMEGEAEEAKVIGAWRFAHGRIEVDLSSKQSKRVQGNRRAKIEKKRDRYYSPLHLVIDEAPDRILIMSGSLKGEYQAVKAPSPTEPLEDAQVEVAPSFEL